MRWCYPRSPPFFLDFQMPTPDCFSIFACQNAGPLSFRASRSIRLRHHREFDPIRDTPAISRYPTIESELPTPDLRKQHPYRSPAKRTSTRADMSNPNPYISDGTCYHGQDEESPSSMLPRGNATLEARGCCQLWAYKGRRCRGRGGQEAFGRTRNGAATGINGGREEVGARIDAVEVGA